MTRRDVISGIVAVALVLGSLYVWVLTQSTGAAAEPHHDESSHIKYAEVQCRGNGPGGYRKCMIRFQRPAKKVAVDIYVGDRYDVGFVWEPDK